MIRILSRKALKTFQDDLFYTTVLRFYEEVYIIICIRFMEHAQRKEYVI